MTSLDLSVPLSAGSDLVLPVVRPSSGGSLSATIAGRPPTGTTDFGSSTVAIWDRDALNAAAKAQGRTIDRDGQRLWAVPLAFTGVFESTDVLIDLEKGKCGAGCAPWSGQARPLSMAPPRPLLTGDQGGLWIHAEFAFCVLAIAASNLIA